MNRLSLIAGVVLFVCVCECVSNLLASLAGLCVCPDLEVFVSSSLDGTVCIWNEENHLIG